MSDHYLEAVGPEAGCTRRHAIKRFAAAAGGAWLSGPLARSLLAAPWGEVDDVPELASGGSPLNLSTGWPYEAQVRHAEPTVAIEPGSARLWTTWSSFHEGAERILVRSFSPGDEAWGPIHSVSNEGPGPAGGAAGESDTAIAGNQLIIAWSQYTGSGWTLRTRALELTSRNLSAIHDLAGSPNANEIHWHPAIATNGQQTLVVWQTKASPGSPFSVRGQWLDANGLPSGDPIDVSSDDSRDCCRPAVAAGFGGLFAVAFDRQDAPGTQNVYLALLDARTGKCHTRDAASAHPASNLTPAVAWSHDGALVWVAWHSNRCGNDGWDIPRWYRLAAFRVSDGTWHETAARPVACLDKRGTVQGFELVRLCISPGGAVCVLGRPSHNFCLQYYSGDEHAPLYRLPADGWGGRGRFLRGAFDDRGSLWVTRRDLRTNVLHRIDGFDGKLSPPVLRPLDERTRPPATALRGISVRYDWPDADMAGRADNETHNLYFGDIHGHSWQSDGMGEPEESYLRARDVFRDDFHALTDHDRFVGKRVPDARWQQQKDIADHYHEPGRFVTLFGQEWTTPRVGPPHAYGHFNIYSADARIPLFDHADPRYRDLADLYVVLRTHNALAIPHHIGWTGAPWNQLDLELTPAVEICSVHGAFEYAGNEPIRHRGGMNGHFVRDGLAAGLRFGVVGGSDQHGLIWHHGVCWKRNAYRAGLTGVWAPELSRESVLDAIRARRTFATTGVKLCVRFTVNDRIMGSVLEADGPPTIRVDVSVPPEEGKLAWLHVVRDGATVHQYGGEGQRSQYSFVDDTAPARAVACYYLRVILEDNNMAWSSPVWVTRT